MQLTNEPAPAVYAHRILAIMQSANLMPGQMAMLDALHSAYVPRLGTAAEMQLGLAYGVGEGWFSYEDVVVRLTPTGQSRMAVPLIGNVA